jgi:PAS domain-containing protein
LTQKGRAWWLRRWQSFITRRRMPLLLAEVHRDVKVLREKQEFFESELRTNGGSSLKDEVRLLVTEAEMERWDRPWPGFRTLEDGQNISVNQAYCELVGVRDQRDLLSRSWQQFTSDHLQGDDYIERWLQTAVTRAQFADKLKIKDTKGNYRGEWLVRIKPLGPYKGKYVFGGRFYPSDEEALRIARENGWE